VVYIDDVNNAWTGYAIANSGAEPANLVLTLRDKNGLTVSVNGPFELGTGKHIAEFAWQRFGTSPESFAGFEGSVECVSDREVAAVALRYDNMHQDEPRQVFSTVPVLVDEAASTLYFPQAADGGSYITNFVLVNPGAFPATARLELFGNDGSPLRFFFDGIEQSSVDVTLSAKGVARLITNGPDSAATRVGWVKVTSSQPIGGAAIFQTQGGGRITSEAGVADSPLSNHFTSWVSSLGETMSGVAICNPNNSQATITLVLKDTIGNVAISRQLFLPPNGHVASFFSGAGQWFPTGFDEFEGTLEVLSDLPVSAVGMRYDNPGLTVFGTIPVIIVP
jgi:hypothetical protein